ncbi:MAG: tetratricopeptide repeat protein [Candidatus Binatales bacterium]
MANLGIRQAVELGLAGKPREAAAEYRRVLSIQPGNAVAHSNLGCVLSELGEFEPAEVHFKRAIALRPGLADSYANFSYLMLKRCRHEEAESLARKCITLDSRHVNGWINLGCAMRGLGRPTDARQAFLTATLLAPERAQAWCFLGDAHLADQEMQLAKECFERAIAIDPRNADAHGGLGVVLSCSRDWDHGIASLARALSIDPLNVKALMNMGAGLYMQSHPEAAKHAYRKAVEAAPDNDAAKLKLATIMPLIVRSDAELIKWHLGAINELSTLLEHTPLKIADPFLEVNFTNFHSGYFGLNELEINRTLAQVFLKACPALAWTAPHCESWTKPERVRVGVVTAFAQDHIVHELFQAIRQHFDRERFEVIAFTPCRRGAQSPAAAAEANAARILPASIFEARQTIAEARLDVMFYLDVFVHPFIYFLSFARLAPVQCTTWGHPVTTGLPNMDYFISADDWEPEHADAHYTERLVRLRELPMYFGRPPVPEKSLDRVQLGLPPDAKLYTCMQSLFKLHPDFDEALGSILRRDPKGRILLLTGEHTNWNKIFAERFSARFADVVDRLFFTRRLSRREYLALLMESDAVLDPFHWGGGNTTIEALAAGIPAPTLPAPYLRGRLTLGFYRKMGIPELIASNAQEFVELNYRIANDPDFRAAMKARIEERLPQLYGNMEAIRELERFFLRAVEAAGGGR